MIMHLCNHVEVVVHTKVFTTFAIFYKLHNTGSTIKCSERQRWKSKVRSQLITLCL